MVFGTLFGLLDVLLKSQNGPQLRVRGDVGLDGGLLSRIQLPPLRPGKLIVCVRHGGILGKRMFKEKNDGGCMN